jgi:hypothetical protein
MGTTRPSLAKLLQQSERLCLAARVCPTHPRENLWCTCQLSWQGTDAEWQELIGLATRLPFHRAGGPTPHRCPRCRDALWCDACFRAEMTRRPSREVSMPLSEEELARYQKLSAYLRLKDHSDGLPPIKLHWGDPTPHEATETEPPRVSIEQTPFSSSPQEATAPAPEPAPEDGDADVDAELADLLAQLQRRLGR